MGQEGEVARGLLDTVDFGILGQDAVGLRGKGNAGAGGDIVENDG
ncbi:hypothetical protein SDC9_143209 [bioreactor metagenome]|uniref:Uncharacterized protein n=1 Tax=bioreactor metagenome TaxID=1076179 RepID=A0A645E5H2_9ZZZZ